MSEQHIGAYGVAFAAGAAASFGPCVAPRFLAAAALAGTSLRENALRCAALAGGLVSAYVGLALTGMSLRVLAAHSNVLYIAFAVVLGIAGARSLLTASGRRCRDTAVASRRLAPAYLIGCAFALVVSPCCGPAIVALAAFASGQSRLYTASIIAAYAAGHAMPLAATVLPSHVFARMRAMDGLQLAARCVSGSLLLALCAYYAVLA